MEFKVLKACLDGISGSASRFTSIKQVLSEITYSKGWASREDLHEAIKRWARDVRPGSVFCTSAAAIIATGEAASRVDRAEDVCVHCSVEGLEYDVIDAVESGDLEQVVTCPHCGERWIDVFTLSEQRPLVKEAHS